MLDVELVAGIAQDLGVNRASIDLLLEPLDLRFPAADPGLVPVQDRPGRREPRLGRLHIARGHVHSLPGHGDPFSVEHEGRPLQREVPNISGTKSVASTWSFFTLSPMSTFHLSM